MTVPTDINRAAYTGNSAATVFDFDFVVQDEADLKVFLRTDDVQEELDPADYTVTLNADNVGGNITYPLVGSPITADQFLVILRQLEYVQTQLDLENQGAFFAESLEDAVDRTVMMVQQLKEEVDRKVGMDETSETTPEELMQALLDAAEIVAGLTGEGGTVRPEDFALGTDALNIAAAITQGMATGKQVLIQGDYSISAAIPVFTFSGSEQLSVLFTGTIDVTADFPTPVFQFHAAYPTPVSVSAITQTTRTFPGGVSATICTKVTAAGHDCAVGDLVKIVSDNSIVPTATAAHQMGEFAYVADASGNDLYFAGYFLNAYATTIRLVKVNTAPRIEWNGNGVFYATAGQSGWDTFFMRVRGFFQPMVRIAAHDGYDVVLELSSCVQAVAQVDCRNMRNRVTSEGVAGYGVQDMASMQSKVSVRGVDARHAYTTNTPSSTAADEPYLYGQTVGAVVSGAVIGASAAAFDMHSEAVDTSIVSTSTASSRLGEDSSGSAIQLRGIRTRAVDCMDRHSAIGAMFYAQTSGDCVDCELINFNYIGPGEPIRINEQSGSSTATRPRIVGGFVKSSKLTAGVKIYNATGVVIEDLYIAPIGSTSGQTGVVLGGDAEVTVRRLTVDLASYTGTNFRVAGFDAAATGNTLRIEELRIINATGKLQAIFNGGSTSGNLILGRYKTDALPSSGDTINVGSLTSSRIERIGLPTTAVLFDLPFANPAWWGADPAASGAVNAAALASAYATGKEIVWGAGNFDLDPVTITLTTGLSFRMRGHSQAGTKLIIGSGGGIKVNTTSDRNVIRPEAISVDVSFITFLADDIDVPYALWINWPTWSSITIGGGVVSTMGRSQKHRIANCSCGAVISTGCWLVGFRLSCVSDIVVDDCIFTSQTYTGSAIKFDRLAQTKLVKGTNNKIRHCTVQGFNKGVEHDSTGEGLYVDSCAFVCNYGAYINWDAESGDTAAPGFQMHGGHINCFTCGVYLRNFGDSLIQGVLFYVNENAKGIYVTCPDADTKQRCIIIKDNDLRIPSGSTGTTAIEFDEKVGMSMIAGNVLPSFANISIKLGATTSGCAGTNYGSTTTAALVNAGTNNTVSITTLTLS